MRIWGYCAEKTHTLLVSKFAENFFLDGALFENLNFTRCVPVHCYGQQQ
jgi:hypothetical protein